MMQALGRYYVRYVNHSYHRTGTLWEGRYKSTLIDSERYFLTVSRYIELNPVRAGMVEHPVEYPWSSYQSNAIGRPISLLTPHRCYLQLGRDETERKVAYQALFNHAIPDYTLDEIRESLNKAWVLGEERFITQIEEQCGRRASPQQRGGDRKSQAYRKAMKNQ